MGNLFRTFFFIDLEYLSCAEEFFQNMSQKGFHLKKIKPRTVIFEKGTPESVQYLIDYSNPDSEYRFNRKQTFTENGYKYVCDFWNFHVYKQTDSLEYSKRMDLQELRLSSIKSLLKSNIIELLISLFIILFFAVAEYKHLDPVLAPHILIGATISILIPVAILFYYRIHGIRYLIKEEQTLAQDGEKILINSSKLKNRNFITSLLYIYLLAVIIGVELFIA